MSDLKNLRLQVERTESSDACTANILGLLTSLLNYLIAQEREAQPEVKGKERLALGADLLVFAGTKSALDRIATALEALPSRRD